MNVHRLASLLALSLMLTSLPLAAAEPRSNAAAEIHLDAETVKRGDVQAATVPMSSLSPSLAAFATVLDPAPLALLGSEIEALTATAAASAAEAARSERLLAADETVSRKSAEAARAAARADTARLSAAKQRVALEWGQGFARMSARERSQLMQALMQGRAALLKIGLSGEPPAEVKALISLPTGSRPLRLLGFAASSDPNYAGPSLLGFAETTGLQPGRVLAVSVSGAAQQGQRLPSEAVLTDAEGRFVYVEVGAGRYRRQPVQVLHESEDGVLVGGPQADARIVLRNAAAVRWASSVKKAE